MIRSGTPVLLVLFLLLYPAVPASAGQSAAARTAVRPGAASPGAKALATPAAPPTLAPAPQTAPTTGAAAPLAAPAAGSAPTQAVTQTLTQQRATTIESIRFLGNRRIPADTLRARIFSKAGDLYDPEALRRDFMSLWNAGFFEDIRLDVEDGQRGKQVVFNVRDRS